MLINRTNEGIVGALAGYGCDLATSSGCRGDAGGWEVLWGLLKGLGRVGGEERRIVGVLRRGLMVLLYVGIVVDLGLRGGRVEGGIVEGGR